jgi:hypothetical protein
MRRHLTPQPRPSLGCGRPPHPTLRVDLSPKGEVAGRPALFIASSLTLWHLGVETKTASERIERDKAMTDVISELLPLPPRIGPFGGSDVYSKGKPTGKTP